jgi:hypothetical protein
MARDTTDEQVDEFVTARLERQVALAMSGWLTGRT